MECIPYSTRHRLHYRYFVVTRCPTIFEDGEIIDKCVYNKVLKFGPWVYNKEGVIFKNKYCAECHGERQIKLFLLELTQLKTKEFQDNYWLDNRTLFNNLKTALQSDNGVLDIKFVPPYGLHARKCMVFEPADDVFEAECTK